MTIPSFRTEHEARFVAERDKPLRTALSTELNFSYAREYGERAFSAMQDCRCAAVLGDQRAFHLAMVRLSLALPSGVFDVTKQKRAA